MRIAIPVLPGAINLQNYLDALEQLGAEGIATERACDYSDCAGLLLPGGADADPALYGQPNRGSEGINRALDDMQLHAALLAPVARLRGRVVAVHRHIVRTPLAQTDAFAVLQIYRGKYNHITPLEEGTPRSAGSIALAWRNARAKLLKSPSQT